MRWLKESALTMRILTIIQKMVARNDLFVYVELIQGRVGILPPRSGCLLISKYLEIAGLFVRIPLVIHPRLIIIELDIAFEY